MAGLPGFDGIRWSWEQSHAWDREHWNNTELWDREPDRDRLNEAFALAKDDYAAAFKIWLDLAQCGSVWSMLEVAGCYERGEGMLPDAAEAEYWYKRAFAGGSKRAMLDCARFAASRGDFAACEAILSVGVQTGWVPAIFWLAWYRLKQSKSPATYRAIRPLLEQAAEEGHPGAEWLLARYMGTGKFGLREIPRGLKRMWRRSVGAVARIESEGSTADQG